MVQCVSINDSNISSTSTDLDVLSKVGDVYDVVRVDLSNQISHQVSRFRQELKNIVLLVLKVQVGISSIKSGDGSTSSTTVIVDPFHRSVD